MAAFTWNDRTTAAAIGLASGMTQKEAAEDAGVSERTIRRWLHEPQFSAEVDRLSLMVEVASRAHRLRLINRVIRQMTQGETIRTSKDILDWLKAARDETDGIKLDLTSLLGAAASLAGSGSESTDSLLPDDSDE